MKVIKMFPPQIMEINDSWVKTWVIGLRYLVNDSSLRIYFPIDTHRSKSVHFDAKNFLDILL